MRESYAISRVCLGAKRLENRSTYFDNHSVGGWISGHGNSKLNISESAVNQTQNLYFFFTLTNAAAFLTFSQYQET